MSDLIAVFDTETTGLPLFKEQSTDPRQPHIVDLCILLFTPTGDLVDSFETMVKPDGWVIPADVAAIHGITTEIALEHGIPEKEALEGFMALYRRAGLRVAHNVSFDDRIMRIGFKRFLGDEVADEFKAVPSYCTCQSSKNIVKCPPTDKMIRAGFGRQFKVPTVTEALKHFYDEDLVGGHRARPDTEACARIYFALQALTAAA
ncbi:3'-5' exonuclease [Pseudomonas caspiana]